MKKLVILKHGGGELANQLWNYISIYAYGLEIKTKVRNPSFFEYHSYFNFIENESAITKLFSFWFRDIIGRRGSARNRFWRNVYGFYVRIVSIFNKGSIVSSENMESRTTYLPPTEHASIPQKKTIYFLGWLFRNPDGLKKFRDELLSAFAPNANISSRADEIINPLRQKSDTVVGIHIRQSDYRDFKDGAFLLDQRRFREIVDEYMAKKRLSKNEVSFLITSDAKVDMAHFEGLNVHISKEHAVTDLFLLSKTDVLIGSNSSFGAFASWYGDIPHIIVTKEPLDWNYYEGKASYFENKYCTLARY